MPSGRTHDQITFICLPWIGALSLLVTFNLGVSLCLCGGFLFSGLMFGPDLDIYSKQYQRWGLLKFIWLPYQKVLSHRSLLSHGPVIGTLLRLLYLGLWINLALIGCEAVSRLWPLSWQMPPLETILEQMWIQSPHSCIALLLGLEAGAMSHSISDGISSGRKAVLKRWKRRS
ncbi:MAG: metal-binding protein [Cyanobacteria bacterium P01_A01_bin.17]